MKRIYKAIILVLFTLVSVNGFAAGFSQTSKSGTSGSSSKANQPQTRQTTAQLAFLKSLSYGDCVDYLKEEMKLSDNEANNQCGAIQ